MDINASKDGIGIGKVIKKRIDLSDDSPVRPGQRLRAGAVLPDEDNEEAVPGPGDPGEEEVEGSSDDDGDDLYDLQKEEETELELFSRLMEEMEETEELQTAQDEDDKEAATGDSNEREDEYEYVDEDTLDPLPEENDPKYDQEDAKYFRTKCYVRNDKYDLSWLTPDGLSFPSIMDVFRNQE